MAIPPYVKDGEAITLEHQKLIDRYASDPAYWGKRVSAALMNELIDKEHAKAKALADAAAAGTALIRETMQQESILRKILPSKAIVDDYMQSPPAAEGFHGDVEVRHEAQDFVTDTTKRPYWYGADFDDQFPRKKGPYLMNLVSDSGELLNHLSGKTSDTAVSYDREKSTRAHPVSAPAWLIGFRELDRQYRGRAINDETLGEMRRTAENLVGAAAATGAITADDHREVLARLKVTPHGPEGAVMITGTELLVSLYKQRLLERSAKTEPAMGPVPMAVGTLRENAGTREVWTGTAWEPETKFFVLTEGFYTHESSKRLAYVLGTGRRRGHKTSANLAFMQWADTNEMFYVPVDEFRTPGLWKKFEG
jgi:hypothetical protein